MGLLGQEARRLLAAGEGPPLLLVHGGVGQFERWAPVWNSTPDARMAANFLWTSCLARLKQATAKLF